MDARSAPCVAQTPTRPTPSSDRQRLSEMVAGTIGKRIVTGQYKPGDTLPTEPEVQAEFGVSRTAVREAIRLLSAKGLTASRPKIGTRVRPTVDWNMFDVDVLRWQVDQGPSDEFVNALFEMREIIEPSAASLAAERATPEDDRRARRGDGRHPEPSARRPRTDRGRHRFPHGDPARRRAIRSSSRSAP